jgi:uncharacterized membrane protein YhhN
VSSLVYFLILAIVLALIYITVELTQKPIISIYVKALASLSFIILGMTRLVLDYQDVPKVMGFILLGLACGMIGDIVLALRPLRPKEEDKLIIVFGIISFSLGHLFYLTALFIISSFSWLALIIGLVVFVMVIIMSDVMKFDMKIARLPSYFYAFLIFFMVGQSFEVGRTLSFNSSSVLFLSGALLFGISDLILAPIYYTNKSSKLMIALNLLTYYGAQILIALSLYFM